jgi:hypothetical protein
MATALDIIKGALRRIGAYQSGETIAPQDANDCLVTFNDLQDSSSGDHAHIFGSVENILAWVPGQNQYTVGNPNNTTLSFPNIVGTITGSTITTTSIPSQLVAGTSILTGSTITDLQAVVPANTYVTAIGATTITLSAPITGTPNGSDTFYWTVPGNFGIARPLRITNAFTRINQLDFTMEVMESQARFLEILYKAQPGPWPTVAWWNNQFPYGILNVYQTPGQSGTLHLFTDTILTDLTLNQVIVAPQGYVRWWKWRLAKELWPEYWGNQPMPQSIVTGEREARMVIEALNVKPAVVSKYDRMLLQGDRPDAGWIITGGMR